LKISSVKKNLQDETSENAARTHAIVNIQFHAGVCTETAPFEGRNRTAHTSSFRSSASITTILQGSLCNIGFPFPDTQKRIYHHRQYTLQPTLLRLAQDRNVRCRPFLERPLMRSLTANDAIVYLETLLEIPHRYCSACLDDAFNGAATRGRRRGHRITGIRHI